MGKSGSLLAAAHRRNQGGGGGGVVIIEDNFNGAVVPNIYGRTPDTVNTPGDFWIDHSFNCALDGAGQINNDQFGCLNIDTGLTNGYSIETEFSMDSGGGYIGFTANVYTYNNSWEFGMYPGANTLECYYNQGGGYEMVAVFSPSTPANTVMTFKIEVKVAGFDLYIDNVLVGTISRSGRAAFDGYSRAGIQFGSPISMMHVYKFKVTTLV